MYTYPFWILTDAHICLVSRAPAPLDPGGIVRTKTDVGSSWPRQDSLGLPSDYHRPRASSRRVRNCKTEKRSDDVTADVPPFLVTHVKLLHHESAFCFHVRAWCLVCVLCVLRPPSASVYWITSEISLSSAIFPFRKWWSTWRHCDIL